MLKRCLENSSNDESLKRAKKRKLILQSIIITMIAVVTSYNERHLPREPKEDSELAADMLFRKRILKRLYEGDDENCYDLLRLTKRAFVDLCSILRERQGLCDTYHVTVEESVAMFLLILGHGQKFRVIRGTYIRSLETISRRFAQVLKAILNLTNDYIKLPDLSIEHMEDDKWKWFKVSISSS